MLFRSSSCYDLIISDIKKGAGMITCSTRRRFISILLTFSSGITGHSVLAFQTNDEKLNRQLLIDHFRRQFEDIHDVSMRFHHKDQSLNGVIEFKMKWEKGKLVGSETVLNETGDPEFPIAILEKMKSWRIDGITGPFETNFPLRIKLVGSDDPTFSHKAILTGKVIDQKGNPIQLATVRFAPVHHSDLSVPDCRSNREGIFVRTLIPPGFWDLECVHKNFQSVQLKDDQFKRGGHHRLEFRLKFDSSK
jgi:hypothetical protein